MVAYSFNKGFAAPIMAGVKRQTIRLPRKRHARPGEELQLFTGMRTRQCQLIGRSICVGVHEVRLDFVTPSATLDGVLTLSEPDALDAFAERDGFGGSEEPWRFMRRWWWEVHPGIDIFHGVLIRWEALL